MVSDILRSVQTSEGQAEDIIKEARQKVEQMRSKSKEDIQARKASGKDSFAAEADRRRAAVKEEEDRKDQEFAIKVKEELDAIGAEALGQTDRIVSELTKKVYAL